MACALTTGFTLDCRDNLGGIAEIRVMESQYKGSITSASGVITAWTPSSSKKFYKYVLEKKTSLFEQNIKVNNENGTVYYEQILSIVMNKMQVTYRNEILLLAKNRLLIIVKDANGKYWLMGETRFAMLNDGGKGTTGTANGDRNGFELPFMAEEPELAQEVDSTIIDALTN